LDAIVAGGGGTRSISTDPRPTVGAGATALALLAGVAVGSPTIDVGLVAILNAVRTARRYTGPLATATTLTVVVRATLHDVGFRIAARAVADAPSLAIAPHIDGAIRLDDIEAVVVGRVGGRPRIGGIDRIVLREWRSPRVRRAGHPGEADEREDEPPRETSDVHVEHPKCREGRTANRGRVDRCERSRRITIEGRVSKDGASRVP
jgi:hypothetical protein